MEVGTTVDLIAITGRVKPFTLITREEAQSLAITADKII